MTPIKYDFKTWREALGWTAKQACAALGCSRAHLWKLERDGAGPRVYVWAAYGLDRYTRGEHIKS